MEFSKLIEWRVRFWILLLIVLIIIYSGCIIPDGGVKGGLDDETQHVLQNGINELGSQPSRWQTTMENTIRELGRVGTTSAKEVLADVQSTYNGALGQTESTAFCGADFIGRRLQQRMQAILHKFDKNAPEPTIVPVICSTNPAVSIDAGPNPPRTQVVTYYGYDFLEFSKTQAFAANLQYGSGQVLKPNFGFIRIPHNYELVLDIQAADYTNVDRAQGPAVVLKWGGQNVVGEGAQSALPVLIPTPTPIPVPPPPPEYYETQEEMDVYLKGNNCGIGDCAYQFFDVIKYPPEGYIVDQMKGDPEHKGLTLISDGTHSFTVKPENHQVSFDIAPDHAKVYGWIKGQNGWGVGGWIDLKFTVHYRSKEPKPR
jgi:hypothetical protein